MIACLCLIGASLLGLLRGLLQAQVVIQCHSTLFAVGRYPLDQHGACGCCALLAWPSGLSWGLLRAIFPGRP